MYRCGVPAGQALGVTDRFDELDAWVVSAHVRQHLGGDELEVLEVAEVDELEVHPVGTEFPEPQQLVDRGIR